MVLSCFPNGFLDGLRGFSRRLLYSVIDLLKQKDLFVCCVIVLHNKEVILCHQEQL